MAKTNIHNFEFNAGCTKSYFSSKGGVTMADAAQLGRELFQLARRGAAFMITG